MMQRNQRLSRRRGSVYIAVLAVATIIITFSVGGILAVQSLAASSDTGNQVADARFSAMSGMEVARLWISSDPSWRTNRSNGAWTPNLLINGATVSLNVVDTVDANLANRPHDPVTITATATKGRATQIASESLLAYPVPLPCLAYAMQSAGQLHITAGQRLTTNGTLSSNSTFTTEGSLQGSVIAASITNNGSIFGTSTIVNTARTLPGSTPMTNYSALASTMSVSNHKIQNCVIGPGLNPYGTANADGVYVVNDNSDYTIQNCRIYGTLILNVPNKTVTIQNSVLIQPYRSDYPSLIINGKCVMNQTTTALNELLLGVNLNPAGVAYNGSANTSLLDVFPSEIDGLVHVLSTMEIKNTCVIKGAIICEGTGNDALKVSDSATVTYDPTLYTNPPQWYTTSVPMLVKPGSIAQSVSN